MSGHSTFWTPRSAKIERALYHYGRGSEQYDSGR